MWAFAWRVGHRVLWISLLICKLKLLYLRFSFKFTGCFLLVYKILISSVKSDFKNRYWVHLRSFLIFVFEFFWRMVQISSVHLANVTQVVWDISQSLSGIHENHAWRRPSILLKHVPDYLWNTFQITFKIWSIILLGNVPEFIWSIKFRTFRLFLESFYDMNQKSSAGRLRIQPEDFPEFF